jgi:hypothetical protein
MIKRILFLVLFFSCCLLANPLSAQAKDILGSSADCSNPSAGTGSSAICTDDSTTKGNPNDNPVTDKLKDIANIIAYIAGASAVILILVGSIQYITSAGDSSKINNAKNTIIYALIGIVIIALAVSIIEFVLNKI